MANIEGMVNSMALTFFCNAMVKSLYYFGEDGIVSEKFKTNCEKAIAELGSLKWPLIDRAYSHIKTDLFNSNINVNTFEQVCEHYKTSSGQMIDKTIKGLKYFVSENSLGEKLRVAVRLQNFFDVFGDFSYYAVRDCVRC